MGVDVFEFWASVPGDARVHPADKSVFSRYGSTETPGHGFDLRCLPAPFGGPLRTARVVLLYLSPGWHPLDVEEASTLTAQARYAQRRKGFSPLDGPEDHGPGWKWWSERVRRFGNWRDLRDKVAFLNIGAYHSKSFTDYPLLAALPSCRVVLEWAQQRLFQEAEDGKRVVVCLRSAQHWGLGDQRRYGKSLFAPAVGRSGHMLGTDENMAVRQDVVSAVSDALARGPIAP